MKEFRYTGNHASAESVFIEGYGFVQVPYITDEMAAISIRSGAKFFVPINSDENDNTGESGPANSEPEETGGLFDRSAGHSAQGSETGAEKQPEPESTSEEGTGSVTDTSVGNTGDSTSTGDENASDTGATEATEEGSTGRRRKS
jgi:hypothetical protein